MIATVVIFWLIVWTALAVAVGRSKDFRLGSAAAIGFFFGPVGVIVLALMRAGRAKCPYCAERIRGEATRCPYCRSDLVGVGRADVLTPS